VQETDKGGAGFTANLLTDLSYWTQLLTGYWSDHCVMLKSSRIGAIAGVSSAVPATFVPSVLASKGKVTTEAATTRCNNFTETTNQFTVRERKEAPRCIPPFDLKC
jgi:hypothetical protein